MPNASESEDVEECLEICADLFHDIKMDDLQRQTKVLIILDDCAVSADVKKRSSKLIDLASVDDILEFLFGF